MKFYPVDLKKFLVKIRVKKLYFSHFITKFHSRISIIRFIIPIQSDKVVYAKIYRRPFVSFPRNRINSSSFIGARTFTPEFSRKDSGMWPKARTLSLSSSLEHMPSEEVAQPEYRSTKHLLFWVSNIFAVPYFL